VTAEPPPINPQPRHTFDICIVGAGVIGLALARALSTLKPAPEILVLEANAAAGQETSSRNSEVIHAGLYYPAASNKAIFCLRGHALLYNFCEKYQIAHKRLGKLIVAQADEQDQLQSILQRATDCGVDSLQILDKTALRHLEPEVQATFALWSPDTGIIDSHGLMQSLQNQAESAGTIIATRSRFLRASVREDNGTGFNIDVGVDEAAGKGSGQFHLQSRILINCAGLHAHTVANNIIGLPAHSRPQIRFIKGSYFSFSGRSPFRHLIYPVPDAQHRGLGIHATLDLNGQCRFGPDIEEIAFPDYRIDDSRRVQFAEAIRRYYPALDESRLHADYCGIRPRLQMRENSTDFSDFMIQGADQHGMPGLFQLFGIESPGLTACLAIAEHISEQLQDMQLL
jgi:L-2-hydroxyglutarate oxidase LhgO